MIWKRIVRDYFTFNKREGRGVYSLIIILLVLSGFHLFLKFYPPNHRVYSEEEVASFDAFSQSFEIGAEDKHESTRQALSSSHPDENIIEWHAFDPNYASANELIELGLKPWVAERVIKYREKIRPFSSVEDLKKVYDIDTNWLDQAAPYISIDKDYAETQNLTEVRFEQKKHKSLSDSAVFALIDLNRADTSQLKTISGIGSFYAKQIVELRGRYGGFRSFDQLLDLYKVRDETLTRLSEKTILDTSAVKRIDLNSCTLEELGRHPYLSWKQARIILAYREQHHGFRTVKEILRTDVITDSVYLKIAPYLKVK